jgi:transcriptional regulator with XRE-family HTH domain
MALKHNGFGVIIMLENLRGLREDRDLTQTDMARELRIHQTTYSDYELGKLNIPTDTLIQLALFFGTSVDYLLGLTDVAKPYPRKK